MYNIEPAKVYVFESVWEDERCATRATRMVKALGDPEVVNIGDVDIPDIIRDNNLVNVPARGNSIPLGESPVFVLNRLRFDGAQSKEEVESILSKCPEGTRPHIIQRLLGRSYTGCGGPIRNRELICRRTHEFHTIDGCLHRCLYCSSSANQYVTLAMNLEEFVEEKLDKIVKDNPWQKVFRYQTQVSDALCFEPEYGAGEVFTNYFAGLDDRYLIFHTSSANVDHLLDLDHKGHTIVLWSLTSDTVSKEIEVCSGTTEERIEAARKCQDAGYTVRFKFKPIVPVKNWREECADMIEKLFAATDPDVLSLCVMMWMTPEEFDKLFDPSMFDPKYVKAVHDSADEMRSRPCGPFPDEVRTEIYSFFIDEIRKHNSSVPVSLSTETKELWDILGPKLGFTAENYVCGCGAKCTPRLQVLDPPEVLYSATAGKK
ncbi:spore photoproduct lyase family protein [Candidatus Poribacteria bacterium]